MRSAFMLVLVAVAMISCNSNSKPTENDVRKKLLSEYVCPETAKIRHFEIVQYDKIKNAEGKPVHRYLVRGEVEWPNGCTDDGTVIPAGRQQSFEQTVFLSKGSGDGWQ